MQIVLRALEGQFVSHSAQRVLLLTLFVSRPVNPIPNALQEPTVVSLVFVRFQARPLVQVLPMAMLVRKMTQQEQATMGIANQILLAAI